MVRRRRRASRRRRGHSPPCHSERQARRQARVSEESRQGQASSGSARFFVAPLLRMTGRHGLPRRDRAAVDSGGGAANDAGRGDVGKLPNELLSRLLARLRQRDPRVVLGPAVGRDAAVIDTGGERLLVAKTDPVTFASDHIGWYT